MPSAVITDTMTTALSNLAASKVVILTLGCDEVIKVQSGAIKSYSKYLLKALGANQQFVLFSNLPLELRERVYNLAVSSSTIKFIEEIKDLGDHTFTRGYKIEARRPALLAASNEAFKSLIRTGTYKPLFQIDGNEVKYYFNSTVDVVQVMSRAAMEYNEVPLLSLSTIMRNRSDLDNIKVLALDLLVLQDAKAWGLGQVQSMKCLTTLIIGGVVPETRADTFNVQLELEIKADTECLSCSDDGEVVVTMSNSVSYYCLEDGKLLKNQAAINASRDHVCSAVQKDRLIELLATIEEAALETTILPKQLVVNIRYVPLSDRFIPVLPLNRRLPWVNQALASLDVLD